MTLNGLGTKQKLDKNQPKKTNGTTSCAPMKHNNSSVDQYKYGKNRVEADAKRLQAKEDELMKKKQEIRNRLTQLKKDRRDLRMAIENTSGVDQYKYGKNRVEADAKRLQAKEDELMKKKQEIRNRLTQLKKDRRDLRMAIENTSERLKKVEDECKLKEEERVNLELELTEVKESLKKALSGGVTLGLTIEPKTSSSSPQSPVLVRRTVDNSPISSCDTSDTETCSLPVNSASLLRRQVPQKNPPVRGHVLRKAKEWEMKSGT
ncbi:actin filament-associated protein 1 isoform X3 [Silurus asotus]|uniref:Actin filament-associated protein 1 isoform X3 n=1 Tax=Silurus asotus TaxID=30991 RepID=A0AAD5F8D4_SILAS|nr:actin filament-associated protein 1 isoform X3 [Silurus asotus]